MYKRILIANRADCAVRLIQACHAENIEAFTIASREDADNAACKLADGLVFTGLSRDAYTNEDDILEAAHHFDCEAILPGWGFLSEDFSFARKCRLMGFHFIGPSSKHLLYFGDKLKSIDLISEVLDAPQIAIPCDIDGAQNRITTEIRGSVMLKCRYGGGGKGIARFDDHDALCSRLAQLDKTRESSRYFAEKAITGGRHIEFQFIGDGRGHVLMPGARDCSLQRLHQKYFESHFDFTEIPALKILAERIRQKLASMQYASLCTAETLVMPDGTVHFLEINPRLQVEHGVTEMTAGLDLVRTAIRIACSNRLDLCELPKPDDAETACEFRLFARSTGRLEKLGFPGFEWPNHPFSGDPHYRIETAYRPNDVISGVYDGLIARFILSGPKASIQEKFRQWLSTFEIAGPAHNLEDLP